VERLDEGEYRVSLPAFDRSHPNAVQLDAMERCWDAEHAGRRLSRLFRLFEDPKQGGTEAITFISPCGDDIPRPALAYLEDLVMNLGEEFWCAGCGQGNLIHKGPKGERQIWIMFAKTAGFYLEYVEESCHFVSIREDRRDQAVDIYVGGDPIKVPIGWFLTREAAWAALGKYCADGERAPEGCFTRRKGLDWNYGIEG
jgi:hypothetical protein